MGIANLEVESPLLPHLWDNKPEHLYNEIKIGESSSLDHIVLDKIWNQSFSLRVNSKYANPYPEDGCCYQGSVSDSPSEVIHQIPTSE